MMQTAQLTRASVESARQRADRAEAIKQAWRVGRPADAAVALRENPDIAGDRAVALDLAYEEFCVRWEAGEILDSAAFCARFSFGASLRRLLTLHRFLDDHPEALGGSPTKWPAAGAPVGDFLIVRELGRGSFARVYLAIETTAGDRPVALKVSSAGSREADTLGPLSHPHLIPVLSSRPVGAWSVVAMPFAGTATLEDVLSTVWFPERAAAHSAAVLLEAAALGGRVDDPPFPARPTYPIRAEMTYEDAVAALAAGMFAAVAYLHERGIAHRDLKPSNVLLGPSGHPYLLDFNLASRVADPWRLAGTLPYMAPEQLAVLAEVNASPPTDGRPGDVFACGVVLFELLTGRHPFGEPGALATNPSREKVAAALLGAQRAGHPDLAALNPRVRRAVRAAIGRCLALDPRERPTAAELAELFSRVGPRRSARFAVPVLAGAAVVGLALGYAALRTPEPTFVPAPDTLAVPLAAVPVVPAAPATPATPFERGMQLYQKGQHGLAAVEFLAAGKADRDGRAYGYAAYCLSVGMDHKEAAKIADKAIDLGYSTAPVYANRASNYLQTGRPQEAKNDCDEALRLDRDLLAARFTRTVACLQLHHQKGEAIPLEALADIELVTAGMSNSPDVWTTAAQLYTLTSAGNRARLDKAALAVRNAVLAGKQPEAIKRNPVLKTLAGHAIYDEALTLAQGPGPQPANPHLANPIP
jgi:serine/threonine protein kinase